MTPEVKARIFEPFYTTTKETGKGTGTREGLSTVYGIVEQNSGAVVVYSEPGKGTTFKILLPVSEGPVTGPRPDSVLPSLEGTETILLVEDEDALRDFVRLVLERHGYQVLSAANGRQGLEMARQHHASIHLLLSDVVMPEMGGLDLAGSGIRLVPEYRRAAHVGIYRTVLGAGRSGSFSAEAIHGSRAVDQDPQHAGIAR